MCRSGKVEHPTREAALDAQKQLVYDNHVRGRGEQSAGLHVYPCPDCSAWHVGHSSQKTPTVYHYARRDDLDGILKAGALVLPKPHRLATRDRRRHTGAQLAALTAFEEVSALLWFSWNAAWTADRHPSPHPPVAFSRDRRGLMRVGVSASVATLRWDDYLRINRTPRSVRDTLASKGYPPDWLATDRPVPFDAFRSIECWSVNAWVNLASITDEEFAVAEAQPQRDD